MMVNKFNIQVSKRMYYEGYDDLDRFLSYFYQIQAVKALGVKKVLEIGVGNATVTNYLRQHGYEITTCDHDRDLNPDIVADIRDLPICGGEYDAIMAFEVLEHIPIDDVNLALYELNRCTKKYVLISVPYACSAFETFIKIRMPRVSKVIRLGVKIPYSMLRTKLNERNREHYWEVGKRECSKSNLRKMLGAKFTIKREYMPRLDSYHRYYVLEKRNIHGNNADESQ